MKKFLAGAAVTGIPLAVTTVFFAKRMWDNMKFVDDMMAQMSLWAENPEAVDWAKLHSELTFVQIVHKRGIPGQPL